MKPKIPEIIIWIWLHCQFRMTVHKFFDENLECICAVRNWLKYLAFYFLIQPQQSNQIKGLQQEVDRN